MLLSISGTLLVDIIAWKWMTITDHRFQFATLEVVITTLQDAYGKWIKTYLKHHEVLVLLMCAISFVLGLPHVMQVSARSRDAVGLRGAG